MCAASRVSEPPATLARSR